MFEHLRRPTDPIKNDPTPFECFQLVAEKGNEYEDIDEEEEAKDLRYSIFWTMTNWIDISIATFIAHEDELELPLCETLLHGAVIEGQTQDQKFTLTDEERVNLLDYIRGQVEFHKQQTNRRLLIDDDSSISD